jgi:MobC-like protein
MKEKKAVRSYILTIRLTAQEEAKLRSLQTKTMSKTLSDYGRCVLLKHPVIFAYRNRSADDFLFHMLALKGELNAIGNNFNQVVHKLHTLDHYKDIKAWCILHEADKKAFLKKTDEILRRVNEMHARWSQK